MPRGETIHVAHKDDAGHYKQSPPLKDHPYLQVAQLTLYLVVLNVPHVIHIDGQAKHEPPTFTSPAVLQVAHTAFFFAESYLQEAQLLSQAKHLLS